MSCDWSKLENIELNSSNITNESLVSLIKLEFDIGSDLSFNRISFWICLGIIIFISFIISYILSYHWYPDSDRQQKLIKLKSLNIYPYTKKEINPYLNNHTNKIKDINETIFDFANIESKSVNSILDSTIEKRPLCIYLLQYMFICTLLIASYLQFYWVIIHWNDAYKSWIETKCYPFKYSHNYSTGAGWSRTDHTRDLYYYLQVNMSNLNYPCGDDHIFYLDTNDINSQYLEHDFSIDDILSIDVHIDNSETCYVHKDNFSVRANVVSPPCCGDDCMRCGRCSYSLGCNCNCCDYACCGYCVCITCGLASLWGFIGCCGCVYECDMAHNKIKVVELSVLNKDNEGDILLRINENEQDNYDY